MNALRWIGTARRVPADPEQAAIWWATRRQSDPARFESERAAFDAWRATAQHADAWERLEGKIGQVGRFASLAEVRELRRAALQVARPWRARTRRYWVSGALAASVVALAWLGWVAAPEGPPPIPVADAAPLRFATAVGEHREVELEDGTRISLNTASAMEVLYTATRRDIRLLDGQALFRVAKDERRPFVVAAGDRLITATGTAFDVRVHRGSGVEVLLVEGKVNVEPIRPARLARWVPALERERLLPGQRLLAPPDGTTSVVVGDVERITAWDDGYLIFRSDRIADAVAEINRYSPVQLVIGDPRIRELKVSGVFPVARSADFVAALEVFYPIQARRSGGAVVLQWRDTGLRAAKPATPPPAVR